MQAIHLALLWHQHQPYYPDDLSGENPMPWVRLHGTKDYWGMAMHLWEIPEMRATINLVPSLIQQIRAYTEDGATDEHLRVSRLPADGLTADEVCYLVDNFFMVHPEHNILPYPRYRALYEKRGFGIDTADRAARRFSRQDILDLQVWSNLVWIHPLAFEKHKELAEFREQGGHWSEEEKSWLLDLQRTLLREVLPLHKQLADRGQVELTTTPYYHPIVPLLWDKTLARQAMPQVQLPSRLDRHADDAVEQIQRAVKYHEAIFGEKPVGMWPSEGSVCQGMIPALVESGLRWLATDEEILSHSTNGWIARDEQGFLRHPELLYRPWRVEEQGQSMQIIFRDHAMSDQIGFHYQRYPAEEAAADMVSKIEAIGHATQSSAPSSPTLVTIILDGENCWEYYPGGGVDFLRALYRRIVKHRKVKPVRVAEYLQEHPASDRLSHLFPGSWIGHNFGIWIGHHECNRAWDLIAQTRDDLVEMSDTGGKTPPQLSRAWEELYIAQGSDWFWWFGDSHYSAQDAVFDRLFRKHLQNVYLALGETPPAELSHPISSAGPRTKPFTDPTGLLEVRVNGRQTYFEWINAGKFVATAGRGSMSMASTGRVSTLYFGFDEERLLLRVDTHGGPVRARLDDVGVLRAAFLKPSGFELLVSHPAWKEPIVQLYHNDVPVSESRVEVAAEEIFELAVPWRTLALKTGDEVAFRLELLRDEKVVETVPAEGAIELTVPSPDFELIMWQA